MSEITSPLQALILGGRESYTQTEVAETARLSPAQVQQFWRSMGLSDVGDAAALTDADLSATLRLASLLETGLLTEHALVDLVRAMGQTTTRLGDWQVDLLTKILLGDNPVQSLSGTELGEVREQVAELLPELEQLLIYVWRRQLAASLGRALPPTTNPEDETTTLTATVGFADIVSFTRLSKQLDDDELGKLVHTFETSAADIVHSHGGRLIKTLGDEVMFVTEDPADAAQIAFDLHEVAVDVEDFQIRVGLSAGPIITRMGDVYGDTANRAARYTALAKPGSTFVDSQTAETMSELPSVELKALTPRPVRGFGIVRPYALAPTSE